MLLAGCSRNAEQQVSDSLYWPPSNLDWMRGSSEPLLLRLSADPVVYISSNPSWQSLTCLTNDEEMDDTVVMPSKIEDILPRIASFQGEQDAMKKQAAVIINGDDLARCSSILKAIDYAKRARVRYILFGPYQLPSGLIDDSGDRYLEFIRYFDFPSGFKLSDELAADIATITISKDGTYQWKDAPVTPEHLVKELNSFLRETIRQEVLPVIRVDADAPFPALRYVLNHIRRAGIRKVSIVPR